MPGSDRDLVVLDRDGVINEESAAYVKSPAEWRAMPASVAAIAHLGANGFDVVVASNQSGIGRGLFDGATLDLIHAKMRAVLAAGGARLAGVYVCPHRPEEGCECRKPGAGLLRQIERDFGRSLAGVAFVGDKASDVDAARAVGARPILVRTGRGEETARQLAGTGIEVYADLAAVADALVKEKHARGG